MNHNHDISIIAQCTPKGPGAIALLRISGANAFDIASKIIKLKSKKKITDIPSHTIHLAQIINKKENPELIGQIINKKENPESIDQVMVTAMQGPNTFTGQDTIEITCHNNQFIIEEIINLAIKSGARYAKEGEFAQRAFLNKKIDLIQAEAINDLINAQTQVALKKSLAQIEGTFSNFISKIEKTLLETLAWCEASFEFAEDVPEFDQKIQSNLINTLKKIKDTKKNFDINKQIRHGIRIALIGAVNAGKSSLFNLLLSQNRAIISESPGTTRDSIEALIAQNGNNLTLIDTAGIRQTKNLIEKEGVNRSLEEAEKSDIILLIFDGSRILTSEEFDLYKKILKKYQNKTILIQNKSDLEENLENLKNFNKISPNVKILKTTCLNKSSRKKAESKGGILFNSINEKIKILVKNLDSPFLINERQYKLLSGLEQILEKILEQKLSNELLSLHLEDGLEHIGQLTGKSIKEDALNKIFKEFCIGK